MLDLLQNCRMQKPVAENGEYDSSSVRVEKVDTRNLRYRRARLISKREQPIITSRL